MILETRASYPHERAYLLKLHVDADPKSGVIVGRLEHLASGEQKRFGNLAELVACLITEPVGPQSARNTR